MAIEALNTFTSTGIKYLRHPQMVRGLQSGCPKPQSIQVSPTNVCNLRCVFCSVDERDRRLMWTTDDLKEALRVFRRLGAGTVEFSGGGDPTMYEALPEIVAEARRLRLKLGMITNGLKLKDLPAATLEAFQWIRVSIVTLDYYETLELPKWPAETTLGMSYVLSQIDYVQARGGGRWTEKRRRIVPDEWPDRVDERFWAVFGREGRQATFDAPEQRWGLREELKKEYAQLRKIRQFAREKGARYVRCVPECFTPESEMGAKVHAFWGATIEELGAPLFFQPKFQTMAKVCWMDAVKPWLHSDGYLYPCNSVSLNTRAHRDFDPKWRLCHWTEIENYYSRRGSESLKFVARLCDRCTFTRNNEVIQRLLLATDAEILGAVKTNTDPIEHVEFV